MKQLIDNEVYNGFLLTTCKKYYVVLTDKKNLTHNIVSEFINFICDERKLSDDLRERCKKDMNTLAELRRRITKIKCEKVKSNSVEYVKIFNDNMFCSIPKNDFDELLVKALD